MSERNYYVICEDGCKFESMTKEQILSAIELAMQGKDPVEYKDGFITTVKETNKGEGLTFWKGTQKDFNELGVDASCFFSRIDADGNVYLFTDDTFFTDLVENAVQMTAEAGASAASAIIGGKQDIHKWCIISIPPEAWDKETKTARITETNAVEMNGTSFKGVARARSTIFIAPKDSEYTSVNSLGVPRHISNRGAWDQFGVRCIVQGDGVLEFECAIVPDVNILVDIVSFRTVASILPSGDDNPETEGEVYSTMPEVETFSVGDQYLMHSVETYYCYRHGADIYFRTKPKANSELDSCSWNYIYSEAIPENALLVECKEICIDGTTKNIVNVAENKTAGFSLADGWQIPNAFYGGTGDPDNPSPETYWEGHFIVIGE